jgi:hypothetical protein
MAEDKPPIELPVEPYLKGEPIWPDANESGWKDTVRMNPGQVTRILVRFAPQDVPSCKVKPGVNLYPFDPGVGPGYVWHCHILDHEDNEMMRPYKVTTYKDDMAQDGLEDTEEDSEEVTKEDAEEDTKDYSEDAEDNSENQQEDQ